MVEAIPRSFEYAPTLMAMSELRWRRGDLARAISYAEQSLAAGMTAELTVEVNVVLATLHLTAERVDLARPYANAALTLAQRVGAPRLLGWAHLASARVAVAAGDLPAATASFADALRQFEVSRTPYDRALALRDNACALGARPETIGPARSMLEEAIAVFEQLGAHPTAARCRAVLAELGGVGP